MQSIFGTDGIRGKFNLDITCSLASELGYALAKTSTSNDPILIGRDTRVSGNFLFEALTVGINSANKEVVDLGICPTPAVPILIKKLPFSNGVMISASHNPPEYNGIKIFNSEGKKLDKSEELLLEQFLKKKEKIKVCHKDIKYKLNKFELLKMYEDSLITASDNESLSGLKIILDTCHGSASVCAEKVFKKLGAEVIVINNSIDGTKINVDCGSTNLKPIKQAISANNADMGFSFDGDADRVIGIDSKGNTLDGDHILFLWGRELMKEKKLSKNILISTLMANLGFEQHWKDIGGQFYRTAVGDKFIYEEILKKKADLGGEQSGHILSKMNDYCGDGILTAIQIAKYCKKNKISLDNWLDTSFQAFPQKLTNLEFPAELRKSYKDIDLRINQIVQETLHQTKEPCRILIRPSGTEPLLRILVEAQNKKLVEMFSIKIEMDLKKVIYS